MRRTNSFSNEMLNQNNNDKNREEMFLSMKETLHRPLQKIKSKELLNCFYIDRAQKEERQINNNSISDLNQENTKILINSFNKEQYNNNNLDSNENKNYLKTNDIKNKIIGRNKYKNKDSYNSGIIDFNTSPNTNPDSNLDKMINNDNNIIINTEPLKQNNYFQNEKNAMNEIKNIALNIKYKINSFKICENNNKLSIEQMNTNNHKNRLYKNNINNINKNIIPFEFIDYSVSNISNNPIKINDDNTNNNFNSNINDIKIELNNNQKEKNNSKDKKDNYNYRSYILNLSNTKIIMPEGDLYSREMAYREKKEYKLEQIRKKEMEEELKEYRFKPQINKVSKKMAKNKTPIYKRLKEIELEKNNKIEKIKDNINKNENEKNKNNIKQKFNEEDFKKWLISNENWNVKKIIKLNSIKKEVKKEEDLNNEDFNFHPKINKNSEIIFKSNYNLASIPVSDRLCYPKENKEQICKKNKIDEKMNFIPEINKNYPISDKYYEFMEADQFQIYNKNLKKNKNL